MDAKFARRLMFLLPAATLMFALPITPALAPGSGRSHAGQQRTGARRLPRAVCMPEAVTPLLRGLVEAGAELTPLGWPEQEETVNVGTRLYLACATSHWRSGSARTEPDRGRTQPRVRGRVAHAANRSQPGPSRKSDPGASPRGRSALRQAADPGELRPQPPRSIRRRHARCRLGSDNCHSGAPHGCETVGPYVHRRRDRASPRRERGHLPWQRCIDNAKLLKLLDPLSAQHANERNEGERFGDFMIRAGFVTATPAGNRFHEDVEVTG
jgi:hypothetical protein